MKWNNLKLSQKFQIGFGALILIVIVVSITSVMGIRELTSISNSINKAKDLQVKILDSYKKHLLWSQELNRTIYTNYKDKIEVELVYTNCAFGKWYYGEDRKNAEVLVPELKPLFDKIEEPHKKLHNAASDISRYYDGLKNQTEDLEKAKNIATIHAIYENEVLTQLGDIGTIFTESFEIVNKKISVLGDYYIKQTKRLEIFSLIFGVSASLLSALIALILSRGILKLVRQGLAYTKQVATGDFTTEVNINSKDEIGELLHSVSYMVNQISSIIVDVKHGIEVFSNASQQLSETAQSLSQGSSEQAANAEEISASIEEMASNIEQNSENSKVANDISSVSAIQIKNGSESVNGTINSINDIASKISIITDIAFQTNILALNAAVEAARAGEYGRGFAVVASEVRKLAERSRVAADEIIQLSSNGVKVADEAGKMLESLVPQIERTANVIQEITTASFEQRTGTDQINSSIQQMNIVTQQNASISEEMATSAEELNGKAEELKKIIGYFKINNNTEGNTKNQSQVFSEKRSSIKQSKIQPNFIPIAKKGIDLKMHGKDDSEYENF